MKRLSVLGVIAPMLAAMPQVSSATIYTVDQLISTDSIPAEVLLNVTGEGTNAVTFNVSLGSGTVADIRGIFFDFYGSPTNLAVVDGTGTTNALYSYEVTGSDFSGSVSKIKVGSDQVLITPRVFDGGVKIGTAGASPDDIQFTSFVLTSDDPLYFEEFGARLTSVYDGTSRDGSSKLSGEGGGFVPQTVPEPATMTMIGVGLGLAGVVRSRKKFTEA